MQKSILFVFPVLPYPARHNGVSIRYTPILSWLREKYRIHVALVVEGKESDTAIEALREHCDALYVHKRKLTHTPLLTKVSRRLRTLLTAQRPHILQSHDAAAIEQFFSTEVTATQKRFDAVVWVTASHLDIGLKVFGGERLIFDAIDSIYLNQFRLARGRLLPRADLLRLGQWEKSVVDRVHTTIYISPIDARAAIGALEGHIEIIPNGVYTQDVPSIAGIQRPQDRDEIVVGFIGHMGYPPNILAATRLAGIFERLSRTDPRYRLLVIGREPAPEVLQLQSEKITITGTVDNIWPHMTKVDFFVFPMLSGAGQQNKVLEAMYAQKPVLCNTTANGGIGAVNGQHLQLCETDDDFVDAIARLAADPERSAAMAKAGSDFVLENYSWNAILPRYEALLKSVFAAEDDTSGDESADGTTDLPGLLTTAPVQSDSHHKT